MTRMTLELPDDLADRIETAAAERGLAPAQLAREAIAKEFALRRPLTFVGIGSSGHGEGSAERHKDVRRA
ncbi:MAG: ribbon-helix-helix domain-containing protein, partial [Actinobacteria bacterium]|nr:ribbon-helix-helix domain-containing protein [Actinomycetota bacterium]